MIKSQESAPRAGLQSRAEAEALDASDPLASFRERFVIDEGIYLDGNSLGQLPRATVARMRTVLDQWGARVVRAWDEGWLELPLSVGDLLGSAVLGAARDQVVVADSTTVCFYKLCSAALDLRPDRRVIVCDVDNFPTDRYVIEGLARTRGLEVRWLRFNPAYGPTVDEVAEGLSTDTALVTFSHISYRSAYIAPMREINDAVHAAGALMLWDLSHSAGSVPLQLDAAGTDLAVGCTYKYLNGGPGAPAYMYVRRELQDRVRQPIWGWLGRSDPFEMAQGYEAAPGVTGLLSGTPPVLSLAAVEEGVRLVAEAGIDAIRTKSIELTEYAIGLVDERLAPLGVRIASPRDSSMRGSHVALAHPSAEDLCAQLIDRGVVVDFRRPDVIRFGFSPLTTRFTDVWDGAEVLRELLVGP